MPPPGFPPVTEAERKAMVEWIESDAGPRG